jgi:hypothetical protein
MTRGPRRLGLARRIGLSTLTGFLAGGVWLAPVGAGAAGNGQLHALRCTTLKTDPPLEAPLYAQQEGASGATDGWWCQMPHATKLPAHFVEIKHVIEPLTFPYSLYSTYYRARSKGGPPTSLGTPGVPGVEVTIDFNSTVDHAPGRLHYPSTPTGKTVTIRKGLKGTLVTTSNDTYVTWRYPTKGVPRYLQGVATVTVTGTAVPVATVLGVARQVAPD